MQRKAAIPYFPSSNPSPERIDESFGESLLMDEDTGAGEVRHSSWVTCLELIVVR
jgi:hypothetical protein